MSTTAETMPTIPDDLTTRTDTGVIALARDVLARSVALSTHIRTATPT